MPSCDLAARIMQRVFARGPRVDLAGKRRLTGPPLAAALPDRIGPYQVVERISIRAGIATMATHGMMMDVNAVLIATCDMPTAC